MKDSDLLPYILPNVFLISTTLSSSQFTTLVLPSLRPLFAVKEPPQNMLTLLDNLHMLQSKTDKNVFRERKSHQPNTSCTQLKAQCRGAASGL
jgi:SCY1-like protein 2